MEDTIVLYTSPEHLNSTLLLANFIAKHHPSIPITTLCSAPVSAASPVSALPSITYRRLPAAPLPPNITKDPVELFFEIPRLNNPNLRHALQQISQNSRIKAFIIDFFCNSAFEVSTSLEIPTFFFDATGTFGLCVFLHYPTIDESIPVDIAEFDDFIEVPGCPPVHSRDFPKALHFKERNIYKHFMCTSKNMRNSAGIITAAFDALEYRAKEAISNGLCIPDAPTPPVYLFGPLVNEIDAGINGEKHECLNWLDKQPPKSVIFLCFGRRGLFSGEQLTEMAVGLENSGRRFLWSVRNPPGKPGLSPADEPDLGKLLPEGFLERTKERGFVIKSWAPQAEVLRHGAVGGFVTHCGRSSVMEAVASGVPMIGWPLYADQRMCRVFMVEEMKVALPLDEAAGGFVTAAELERRVNELLDSKEGRAIRNRVGELRIAAAAAMREGGSSVVALEKFIALVTLD